MVIVSPCFSLNLTPDIQTIAYLGARVVAVADTVPHVIQVVLVGPAPEIIARAIQIDAVLVVQMLVMS